MKKLIPVFLCLVFIISAMTAVGVSAATKSQNGLEATLTVAKAEYKANEKIDLSLTVKNIGTTTVKNVQTEIVLPDGVSVTTGNLKQSAFDLAASESKVATVSVKKSSSASANGTSTNNNSTSGAPQTSDASVVVPVAVMILSGIAVAFIAVKSKRAAKGMMSVFLCVLMLGAAVMPTVVSADSERKEFTVEESLKIDGKTETVKAVISYGETPANDNPADSGSADTENQSGGNNDQPSGDQPGNDTTSEQPSTDTNPAGDEILGEGSEAQPYLEIPDENMIVTTVAIPAGGALYYDIYRVGGMILVINDANAYVEYNGNRYDAVNGVVEIWLENALASEAISFAFGNNGSSDSSLYVEFLSPTGTYMNPTIIETMGEDIQISLEEGNDIGYYYKYYAEQTGTIRFYLTASVDSLIVVTNNRNSAQRNNDTDDLLTDENGESYIEIDVEEGDELIITVGAKPNKRGKFPATDITWIGKYV